jgi:hypothetical protein
MDAAAYAIVGTAVGATLSGAFAVISSRIQARSRQTELRHQEIMALRGHAIDFRAEKCQKYASFLSAFWQEERHVSEMLEHLTAQRSGWSKAITRINKSPEHQKALESLNELLGWLSILCEDETVEECCISFSAQFDRMMEGFACALEAAREGECCDADSIAQNLDVLRSTARELSSKLRADARVFTEPCILPATD